MGCKSDGVSYWGKIFMEIEPISSLEVLLEEDKSYLTDETAVIVREDMLPLQRKLEEIDLEAEEIVLRKEEKGGVLSILLFFKLKSLGAVSVKLTKEIDRLSCSVKCENPSASLKLKENLPLLRAMLPVVRIDIGLAKNISNKFKMDIEA
jgi:hypothetical protein